MVRFAIDWTGPPIQCDTPRARRRAAMRFPDRRAEAMATALRSKATAMNHEPESTPARRIDATPAALALIERLQAKFGPLMFHQTGDAAGAAPACYPEDEFFLGQSDVCLGAIGGAPYYVSDRQFERCQHEHLTVDVTSGRGRTFSLENGEGVRFLTHSRQFTDAERRTLGPARRGCPDGGPAHAT